MKRHISALPFEPDIGVLVAFADWEAIAVWVGNRVLLPPPGLVFPALAQIFTVELVHDIGASLRYRASDFVFGAATDLGWRTFW